MLLALTDGVAEPPPAGVVAEAEVSCNALATALQEINGLAEAQF